METGFCPDFGRKKTASLTGAVAALFLVFVAPCGRYVPEVMAVSTILIVVLFFSTIRPMKRKHQKTLESLFAHPVSGNVQWRDIEALLIELGAEISEREGSRVLVRLFGDRRVFHRPHPSPNTDKGAVASVRDWLNDNGVKP